MSAEIKHSIENMNLFSSTPMKSLNIAKSFRSFSSDGFKPTDLIKNGMSKLDISALSARSHRTNLRKMQSIKNLLVTSNVLKLKEFKKTKKSNLTNNSDLLSDISIMLSQYNNNTENQEETKNESQTMLDLKENLRNIRPNSDQKFKNHSRNLSNFSNRINFNSEVLLEEDTDD